MQTAAASRRPGATEGRTDPLTYGIGALRHIVYGSSRLAALLTQFSLGLDLAVTAAAAFLLLLLASWAFGASRSA